MAAKVAVKREVKRLRDEPPGHRFEKFQKRLHKTGSWLAGAGGTVVGVLLTLVGVALLFLPGPGLLVVVAGLALLAGRSKRLARLLDRAEVAVRKRWRRWRGRR